MQNDFLYILGPCAIDSEELYLSIADHLVPLMGDRNWLYKASWDKANRTSVTGGRGVGLERGLDLFREVKRKYPKIKLTTDVHEVWQVEKLSEAIDVIQIPAFLGRQTDLVVECARHFNFVNIKKMQHLGPRNVIKSLDKIKDINPKAEAWLTERGTSLGYDHEIVDFTVVDEIRKYYDRFIFDVTHSTQRSRAEYGVQGDPVLAGRYFLASEIMGYNGVFAEVHPDPKKSTSDGDCMIHLKEIAGLVERRELFSNPKSFVSRRSL